MEKTVKFSRTKDTEFIKILRKRVNDYFKTNNITKYGNANMVVKTITMLSLYFIPYIFVAFGIVSNPFIYFACWMLMAVGMAGIGLSVMHDANHGAYSKNQKVNKYLGDLLHLVGGSAENWKIQHNVLHHSFTNIEGHDEDISHIDLFRFSPHKKRYKLHRFQHWYAWIFYSFMTIYWSTTKDFAQLARFKRKGLIHGQGAQKGLLGKLILWKLGYYAFILVIPMIFAPVPLWLMLVSFFSMHLLAGLVTACIFQSAHVMPTSEYPLPDDKGNIENNWAIHQLQTTCNFSPSSRIFSWFIGGLNYQIEHHLFPNICHVHYKQLSKIVQETAREFNLPYHTQKNFVIAVWNHRKMLRQLAKND